MSSVAAHKESLREWRHLSDVVDFLNVSRIRLAISAKGIIDELFLLIVLNNDDFTLCRRRRHPVEMQPYVISIDMRLFVEGQLVRHAECVLLWLP